MSKRSRREQLKHDEKAKWNEITIYLSSEMIFSAITRKSI